MVKLAAFIDKIAVAANNASLVKLTFGNHRSSTAEVKNIYVKPVLIKERPMLSFVYRHPTKDITKNFEPVESLGIIGHLLKDEFLNADLYTSSGTVYFSQNTTGGEKLIEKKAGIPAAIHGFTHDKQKNRLINAYAPYLHELGITTKEGVVKKEMQHKFRQINHYVEIIDGILKDARAGTNFKVADMGSGKGYLTFALYDHLKKMKINAHVSGIEMRQDLVEKCNTIAELFKYDGLHFEKGSISDTELPGIDMLIALHACDTATDDAIAKGIKACAAIIICAPCCHKQIRKQVAPQNALRHIVKHGILLERQAEMVTDTIRALMLEAHGYKTRVFDFIEEEDTPKNILIVGIKQKSSGDEMKENLAKIKALKDLFGIKEHYIETVI